MHLTIACVPTSPTFGAGWWETSTTIGWSFSNLEAQCCSLSEPLSFSFYYFMLALSVVILYRQHGAMGFVLIKKRADDHSRLRIEQLAREKERLDYERSLERKLRLVADALRRTEQPAAAGACYAPSASL